MIEDRLRRDAAAWKAEDAAPDLDEFLARATTRRSRLPWLAAAAIVVLIAGAAIGVAVWPKSGSSPAGVGGGTCTGPSMPRRYADYLCSTSSDAPLPSNGSAYQSTLTVTRDGHAYIQQPVEPAGAQIDPHDPAKLEIYSFTRYGSGNDPVCNQFGSVAQVDGQTSTTVTISTTAFRAPLPHGNRTVACTSFGASTTLPVVHLSAPLGSRQVIDEKTGKRLAVFTAGELPPKPAYLPNGYVQRSTSLASQDGLSTREYRPAGSDTTMEVAMISANWWTFGTPVDHVTVGRYNAITFGIGAERCVGWITSDARAFQVCSRAYGSDPLAWSDVLKVARSLP